MSLYRGSMNGRDLWLGCPYARIRHTHNFEQLKFLRTARELVRTELAVWRACRLSLALYVYGKTLASDLA
jgi:hypothetical protein